MSEEYADALTALFRKAGLDVDALMGWEGPTGRKYYHSYGHMFVSEGGKVHLIVAMGGDGELYPQIWRYPVRLLSFDMNGQDAGIPGSA